MKKNRFPSRKAQKDEVANLSTCQQGKNGFESGSACSMSRRRFLGGITAATLAAGVLGSPSALEASPKDCEVGPLGGRSRTNRAYQIREEAARDEFKVPFPNHSCNGDQNLYPNKIGNYSKGLPHNELGEVDLAAYHALLRALASGEPMDFELIPLGGSSRLVNPQAGLAFDLEGADSHQLLIPPAPSFASAEEAGEMVELCWMALLRDVPFAEYDTNNGSHAATHDLSRLSDFRGPKEGRLVAIKTLFRGLDPYDQRGPYVSQFFWLSAPFGANYIEQQMATARANVDYLTTFESWLAVQNGCLPSQVLRFEPQRRYIINGRDLAQWVHMDVLFQAYFTACLCMAHMGVPANVGNPYNSSKTQVGFGTFGLPHFKALVCEVATRALKVAWFQKWFVHRRLRPEAFGGRVELTMRNVVKDAIHKDLFNSAVLPLVFDHNSGLNGGYGSYLLPQAYPEGSPLHPAYAAGHATVAGACVTLLKALFDETFVIPDPVVPDPNDPTRLIPYTGPALSVGGELNKLAYNVAFGRNFAGIHWRSDGSESLKLGEKVAISILREQKATYNEAFSGFTFTKFDGAKITV
jgi:hypothetical protein